MRHSLRNILCDQIDFVGTPGTRASTSRTGIPFFKSIQLAYVMSVTTSLEAPVRARTPRGIAAPESPVFILGMHRSGTTVLYEMLSATGNWNTLWAWHVASYDEILAGRTEASESQARFAQRLADAGMETRGVDAVKAGPETKEEYCFITDNKGYGSKLTDKAFPLFCEICQTVQGTQPQDRPLLLKNPWDFGNAPVIRRLIPSARFVYIHRHPIETINSMWKFLNQAFQEPNAYMAMMSERYADVTRSKWKMGALRSFVRNCPGTFIEGLILWFGKQCKSYLQSIDQIPQAERVEITYDQLCGQPNETMQRIREHLNLVDDGIDFSSMVKRRPRKIDARVDAKSAKIEKRAAKYLAHVSQFEQPAAS